MSVVVCDSNNPNVYYAGACAGGVWKSIDGGTNWFPIFDDQPAQSIGALAIAPSDSNIVWVGTGEGFIRSNVLIGNGVYKSADGGKTWKHMGLEKTGRISRFVIHPRDPNVVFVGAVGHCYGPQKERGIFRTGDGGKTWQNVKPPQMPPWGTVSMINSSRFESGRCYLAVDGHQENIHDFYLFKTTDYGKTWKLITAGIPRDVFSYTRAIKEDSKRPSLGRS
ncbi:MAG: WD40/YVTN/BNR-like repeat-containing protein [Candidatus Aminicenantales bacterium]